MIVLIAADLLLLTCLMLHSVSSFLLCLCHYIMFTRQIFDFLYIVMLHVHFLHYVCMCSWSQKYKYLTKHSWIRYVVAFDYLDKQFMTCETLNSLLHVSSKHCSPFEIKVTYLQWANIHCEVWFSHYRKIWNNLCCAMSFSNYKKWQAVEYVINASCNYN